MAAINSKLFTKDSAQATSTLKHTENTYAPFAFSEEPLLTSAEQTPPDQMTDQEQENRELLEEIQALQQALKTDTNFDFSELEAPAAGNIFNTLPNTEKSHTNPILLEEDGLVISYRENLLANNEVLDQNLSNNLNNIATQTSVSAENAISDVIDAPDNTPSNATTINASVTEDFSTLARGTLSPEQTIAAQSITSAYGTFASFEDGHWEYQLANDESAIQSLGAGQSLTDTFSLRSSSGEVIEFNITIQGTNDQAIITGQKYAAIQAETVENLHLLDTMPSVSGTLQVSDIDTNEAQFVTGTTISGSYGTATINSLGEWQYTLNNHSDAVQGLRGGEKVMDLISVKTLDGTKQLIRIDIDGVDDKPILSGTDMATLDLETDRSVSGSLTIKDPDFGESSFQAHDDISSVLGFGKGSIDTQGNWEFNLDSDFAQANPIAEGETRIDSFTTFTADGTSLTVYIPIEGSDQPFFSTTSEISHLSLNELMDTTETSAWLNEAGDLNNSSTQASHTSNSSALTLAFAQSHDSLSIGPSTLNELNLT